MKALRPLSKRTLGLSPQRAAVGGGRGGVWGGGTESAARIPGSSAYEWACARGRGKGFKVRERVVMVVVLVASDGDGSVVVW